MTIIIPSQLSNDELLAEVKRFASCERKATAQLVAHLVELEARGLHLAAGFPSLFAYCGEVLHLSEDATYNRIEAARAARRFPVILEMLDEGSLSVTTARLLGKCLTPQNHEELLAAASGQSKRAVEELIARHAPRPDVPTSVRKLPGRTAAATPIALATTFDVTPTIPPTPTRVPAPLAPEPSPRPALVIPLSPNRYELKVTMSETTREKLLLAQDLLRHAVPSGGTAEIIDRALTLLLEDLARKKFAATGRPRESRGTATGSRHIPAEVKRAVWLRDGGRCAFVAGSGRRCNARGLVELHHRKPYAAGGEATVANIELRCAGHNAYEAELFFAGMVRESGPLYGVSV